MGGPLDAGDMQRAEERLQRERREKEAAQTVPNQDGARLAFDRANGLRQLATMPAETVPNQDGTAAAEAALSPDSARMGWPANRRRTQAERPRARRLACQQTSARPGPPRPRHPPRRPRSPVPPIRKRLSRPEARARTIEPKHISRASFLRTDRSRPPRHRGERPPVPCQGDSGPRRTLRKSNQSGVAPSRSGLDRPLPCSRVANAARGAHGAGLRATELSEASASAGGRRSV